MPTLQHMILLKKLKAPNGLYDRNSEDEDMADRSRSPTPPHNMFSGEIIRLCFYPPPPTTGGISITNEDLFCMNDGEFLNDVIIDFYLKYVYLTLGEIVDILAFLLKAYLCGAIG